MKVDNPLTYSSKHDIMVAKEIRDIDTIFSNFKFAESVSLDQPALRQCISVNSVLPCCNRNNLTKKGTSFQPQAKLAFII